LENSVIRSYEDLEVYRRGLNLTVDVYSHLKNYPRFEQYELCSQMRRASRSIPCNIAEGYGKKRSTRDFVSYLAIAMCSANEMVVHLEISKRLGYISVQDAEKLQEEYKIVGKMLNRLSQNWRSTD